MDYVCENFEINKEKTTDRSAALAEYAKRLQRGSKEEKEEEKNA